MHLPAPLQIAALVALLMGVHPNPVSAESERLSFVQDRLAIGMWVPPQTDVDLESRYQEIADAHFTVVIGTAGTNAAGQLALCERLGLRAIVSSSGPVESFPDGPACWGYLLTDEPNVAAFPELAKTIATLRAERPGRLGYVNLFPNYASPEQLGSPSYHAYVARFVDTVRPDVLSMDHYPLMRPNADRRDAYCDNLEVLRGESLKAGIPFWNYFHAMPFADRIDPTEAQMRWQIFTSLAYGAKGVLYFCYWTPGKGNAGTGEFPKGGALLTAEGRKTRHYDEARRINGELLRLGPTLMSLTSTGVRRLNTSTNVANPIPGFPIRSVARVGTDPDSTFIAGAFTQRDGHRAVLLVNHDITYTAWPTVTFDVPAASVFEVDKATGRLEPVVDDSPELPGLQLSFGPGDGRLFLMPSPP